MMDGVYYQKLIEKINKDKWIGIAIEAQGTYWHSDAFPDHQERDRKKRLICKEKNIILLEIKEEWGKSIWKNKVLEQLKEQVGIEFTEEKLSGLRRFLGNPAE